VTFGSRGNAATFLVAVFIAGSPPAIRLRPDELAHHDRRTTQAIARRLYLQRHAGLRWWSSLTGAWHSTVVFTDREAPGDVRFGAPERLTLEHPAVLAALPILGIRRR
jgi:hypothetical protein